MVVAWLLHGQLYVKKNIEKCRPSKTGLDPLIVQSKSPIDQFKFWIDLNADMCVCV